MNKKILTLLFSFVFVIQNIHPMNRFQKIKHAFNTANLNIAKVSTKNKKRNNNLKFYTNNKQTKKSGWKKPSGWQKLPGWKTSKHKNLNLNIPKSRKKPINNGDDIFVSLFLSQFMPHCDSELNSNNLYESHTSSSGNSDSSGSSDSGGSFSGSSSDSDSVGSSSCSDSDSDGDSCGGD